MIKIEELIPSKDIRKYMEEQGRFLSDFEKAVLLYNHIDMGYEDIAKKLNYLMEQTEDVDLKHQIEERLDFDMCCFKDLLVRKDSEYYELTIYNDDESDDFERIVSINAQELIEFAKRARKSFAIDKVRLDLADKVPEDLDYSDCIGRIDYDENGKIVGVYNTDVEWECETDNIGRGRFERAYINIPYPFKRGDLVKESISSSKSRIQYYIIEDEYIESEGVNRNRDYSDMFIRVTYLDDDAYLGHTHCAIVNLEYAIVEETEPKKSILEAAQKLMRGTGSLGGVQELCDMYRYYRGKIQNGCKE